MESIMKIYKNFTGRNKSGEWTFDPSTPEHSEDCGFVHVGSADLESKGPRFRKVLGLTQAYLDELAFQVDNHLDAREETVQQLSNFLRIAEIAVGEACRLCDDEKTNEHLFPY